MVAPYSFLYWRGERLVAERLRCFGEQRAGVGCLHRRVRVLACARALERIAAGDDLALDVARLAGDAVEVFESVEMRFQLIVGDAPVLQGAVLCDLVLSIAREGAALRLEIPRQEA